MKRWLSLISLMVLAGALGWIGVGRASNAQAPAPAPAPGPGPNPRFYAVQQKLDPGGSFYLYTDLKGCIRDCVENLRPIVMKPGMPPEALQIYTVAARVLERLGLYGIHDLGLSVIPDGDLNRTKCYVSAPEGRSQGILALLGGAPHPFSILDRASTATLLLCSADCDTSAAWRLVRQVAQDVAGARGLAQVNQAVARLNQQTGLDLEAINASLGGEFILIADQDPAFQMSIPVGPQPVRIASPRLTIMIKVKDTRLYEGLKAVGQKQGLPVNLETTEGKLKYLPLPAIPNPIWLFAPAFGCDGEYVYITTHIDYMKRLAAPPAGGPLLRDSAEFKRLQAGLPAAGNGLGYVSPRLGEVVARIVSGIQPPANEPQVGLVLESLKKDSALSGSMNVRVNEPDGVLVVGRSKVGASQYIGAMLVAPAAILAAIAVPNFLEAQTRSKVARVKADLRTMATAIEAYRIDTNKLPAWTDDPARRAGSPNAPAGQPSFMLKSDANDKMMTLTTPVSYLSIYPMDPFAPKKNTVYSYWARPQGAGYILWSPGPDGRYDLNLKIIDKVYITTGTTPSPELVNLTYDPSNGTRSAGDIVRTQ